MSSRHTEGKVRDFKLTKEDAARVAECFNSFDDSDSWPGGFTHGNPFTAERVFESLQKRDDIRIIVAYRDEKIVGYCNVCSHYHDEEAAYVGLLGANPAYHGKGYGKAMLIEAAETAAKVGKRRIDLHTWGGNLKAMPLYKRVGYNWVPGTRVLMESHIPGILNAPLFKEFFKRHYWYDAYKREITQEIDEINEDGFGVFRYHFEGGEDSLDVTIDREAKGICGFTLTLDGKTVSADVRPTTHIGYIGFGEIDAVLRVTNRSDSELSYSILLSPLEDFEAAIKGKSSGCIVPGETVKIPATYSILPRAKPIDREVIPDDKIITQAEWTLTLGDASIKMFNGLIPTEAVSLYSAPRYPTLAPGETRTVSAGLRNNTESEISGELVVAPQALWTQLGKAHEFKLDAKGETEIDLKLEATPDAHRLNPIGLSVFVREGRKKRLVNQKTLPIPILGVVGAAAYEGLERYVLENEQLRFLMFKTPAMALRRVEYKPTGFTQGGWFGLPSLGYPFPEGSEWARMQFRVKIRNLSTHSEIELEGDSAERPGLRWNIIHRIYPGREYLETSMRLTNLGSEKHSNLGVRLGGWFPVRCNELHVPVRDDIYRLDSIEWNGGRQVPRKPEFYKEHWCSSHRQEDELEIGYIWSEQDLVEVRPRRSWNPAMVEYNLPELKPGMSIERPLLWMTVSQGTWRRTRALWGRISGHSTEEAIPIEAKSDLQVELVPATTKEPQRDCPPLLVDLAKEDDKFELRVRVLHFEPISGKVDIRLPTGITAEGQRDLEIEIPEVKLEKPYKKTVHISAQKGKTWLRSDGELTLNIGGRKVNHPLLAVVYDSSLEPDRGVSEDEGLSLSTLTVGDYQLAVSPEFTGSLVRFGNVDEGSVFLDRFPESGPFVWWDRFYSGLNPVFAGWQVWDFETALRKESWRVTEASEGHWSGYELRTKAKHSPGVKGMEFRVKYLMLPGVPLLYAKIQAKNTTSRWRKIRLMLRSTPLPDGVVQSNIHTVFNNAPLIFPPNPNDNDIPCTPKHGWMAFENPVSGRTLGIISNNRAKESLAGYNLGEKAQRTSIWGVYPLKPGDTASVSGYFVITDSVEDVPKMNTLPTELG